jgi:hypothetical protein
MRIENKKTKKQEITLDGQMRMRWEELAWGENPISPAAAASQVADEYNIPLDYVNRLLTRWGYIGDFSNRWESEEKGTEEIVLSEDMYTGETRIPKGTKIRIKQRVEEATLQPTGREVMELIKAKRLSGSEFGVAVIQALESLNEEGYFDLGELETFYVNLKAMINRRQGR